MIGLVKPTSGTAYVHGMDINMDMGNIYTNMGVCPQHKYLLLSSINLAKSFPSLTILFNYCNLCVLNAVCFGKHWLEKNIFSFMVDWRILKVLH